MIPTVVCPQCQRKDSLQNVLTAQSNQNVIYKCSSCSYEVRNIVTNKG